jgi:glycerophosphoryl diester phosphodiesterase
MKKIAHRFYRGKFEENSMEGLLYTIKQKVWAVETDIQMTKDGIPVIIHDELLDRTTNQIGYVNNWTLDELNKYCVLDNSGS